MRPIAHGLCTVTNGCKRVRRCDDSCREDKQTNGLYCLCTPIDCVTYSSFLQYSTHSSPEHPQSSPIDIPGVGPLYSVEHNRIAAHGLESAHGRAHASGHEFLVTSGTRQSPQADCNWLHETCTYCSGHTRAAKFGRHTQDLHMFTCYLRVYSRSGKFVFSFMFIFGLHILHEIRPDRTPKNTSNDAN